MKTGDILKRCEICGEEIHTDTELCDLCIKSFNSEDTDNSSSTSSASIPVSRSDTGLSPDYKQRIYLEEKARFDAQQKLKKESESLGVIGKIIVCVVTVTLFIAYNNFKSTSHEERIQREHKEVVESLKVDSWQWKHNEYGNVFIAGTVKNPSVKKYSYAQVDFNLYDKSGAQVGTAMANVNNLEPHGTWKFEAIVLEHNAEEAKLNSVSGHE